jgi:hypothetical protein
MNARTTAMKVRALRRTRAQIAAMLSRYPNVSPEESDAIVEFLRKGRHIDVGMLTADETLKPNVDAFMNDHKAELGVKLWEAAALIGGIAAFWSSRGWSGKPFRKGHQLAGIEAVWVAFRTFA